MVAIKVTTVRRAKVQNAVQPVDTRACLLLDLVDSHTVGVACRGNVDNRSQSL
ncbi:hypothetical protein BMS3Bbin06_00525 [bacterium BMS3Bbin06]|nr:hypothetical protein BMS3Abin08_02289 [bacterium BMS3Abin08]GBE34009.1 hypothetical protein BMS3Bbin06_00525 [bacterium BMS3Bbin06]